VGSSPLDPSTRYSRLRMKSLRSEARECDFLGSNARSIEIPSSRKVDPFSLPPLRLTRLDYGKKAAKKSEDRRGIRKESRRAKCDLTESSGDYIVITATSRTP
jgi:hypothetical protein